MPDTPVIDLDAIENLRSLNPGDNDEFLGEIVHIFLADTPQRIAELEQSLTAADVAKFARAAHSIKGSSANLGAVALRAVAEKLEHQSRKEGLNDVGPMLLEIKSQFAQAQVALEKTSGGEVTGPRGARAIPALRHPTASGAISPGSSRAACPRSPAPRAP